MNVKIADIMVTRVVTSQPHHTIDHIRKIMQRNDISAVPIVNGENEAVGIITSNDLRRGLKGSTPVSSILQPHVYQVPAYNDISIAAKVMRKNKIHHLVVTHEGAVVGIISSFDLLQLIDEHRFVMHSPPSVNKKAKEI